MLKIFFKGLLTGLFLQIAVGPVFFYIAGIVLQGCLLNGLVAVLAVTAVDYLYIILAILGVGKVLEVEKVKNIFGIISAAILIIFGLYILTGVINFEQKDVKSVIDSGDIFSSFISAFILTVSSPLTIVFWTGVFSAKAIEYSLTKKGLFVFGLAAGVATFLFLGISVVMLNFFKTVIPMIIVKIANIAVGSILIAYGGVRGVKIFKKF